MWKKNTTTTIHLTEEVYNYVNELRSKTFISASKYVDVLIKEKMREVKSNV